MFVLSFFPSNARLFHLFLGDSCLLFPVPFVVVQTASVTVKYIQVVDRHLNTVWRVKPGNEYKPTVAFTHQTEASTNDTKDPHFSFLIVQIWTAVR